MYVCMVGQYGDIPLGLYLVRGDSVVILGEVDPIREESQDVLTKVSAEVRSSLLLLGLITDSVGTPHSLYGLRHTARGSRSRSSESH